MPHLDGFSFIDDCCTAWFINSEENTCVCHILSSLKQSTSPLFSSLASPAMVLVPISFRCTTFTGSVIAPSKIAKKSFPLRTYSIFLEHKRYWCGWRSSTRKLPAYTMLGPAISMFSSSRKRNLACFCADESLGKYNLFRTSFVWVILFYCSYLIDMLKLLLVFIL